MARFIIMAALLVPGLAFAQEIDLATGQAQTQFTGRAPLACLLSTPVGTQVAGAVFTTSGASAQLTFSSDTLINPQTAIAQAFSMSLTVPVLCNAAHSVTVRSVRGGMAPATQSADVAGFSSRIDFGIGARWAGTNVTGTTNGAPLTLTINTQDAASGSIEVNLTGIAGTNPLVAGRYSDEIVIDLVAQQ
jgi:hypothetical protein